MLTKIAAGFREPSFRAVFPARAQRTVDRTLMIGRPSAADK
jgi:hypothetical protein